MRREAATHACIAAGCRCTQSAVLVCRHTARLLLVPSLVTGLHGLPQHVCAGPSPPLTSCAACSEAEGESDEDMSSEDESLASEGDDESEYEAESDEEEGERRRGGAAALKRPANFALVSAGISNITMLPVL